MEGITPLSKHRTEKYIQLVVIAKKYFLKDEYEGFAQFFQEGQYFIELWAAHLILEYGSPNIDLISRCIKVIKKYSNNPLAIVAAEEEKEWLNDNKEKYKEYI